jgi:exopolyphosphatase/guanosine-5'-triphosphate,3'-diphosphate pyrophosphatase
VRRACIDLGSNTTRLLVADCDGEHLSEVAQQRSFTQIGRAVRTDGAISDQKIAEVVAVVVAQLDAARELGAVEVHGVATAAIRRAANGAALVSAIESACALRVEILSSEQEARLAFIGAVRTLDHRPTGDLGVVDVGGGSSELVVGAAPDQVRWSASLAFGSGDLADDYLLSDPPSVAELAHAKSHVTNALRDIDVPRSSEAVAVGGSATSLRRFAGPRLDAAGFARSLALLGAERASEISQRFALDLERVRLLPAGLIILQAASELFGSALELGRGGIREAVLLGARP